MKIITLKYDPETNTLEIVEGNTVLSGIKFMFASNTGKLETQFQSDSPDSADLPPQKRPDTHQYLASKPGKYNFECFINGVKAKIGGDMEVLPPEN